MPSKKSSASMVPSKVSVKNVRNNWMLCAKNLSILLTRWKNFGEHCVGGLIIPDPANLNNIDEYFKLAVCRPDACTAGDLNAILSRNLNFTLPLFQDAICQTKETGKALGAADIVTIVIMVITAWLMVVSTIYDFYLYKWKAKPRHPLFLAFSVLTNGRKLLHIGKNSKDQINIFNGLKVISMMWIVGGHGFVGWVSISVTNRETADNWLDQRSAGYITPAHLAVDTFFFISGFLLTYQYLKQKPKPFIKHLVTVPQMYLHRYLRLTPALLMMYLVAVSLFKHMGNGPIYPLTESLAAPCRKYWWAFFLYIQNYYNYDDLCMTQTWYLSADMQMFLLSPLIIIPIAVQLPRRLGYTLSLVELLILNLFCIAIPMAIKLVYRDYTNDYDTHSRLIDYFVGVMLALFMRVKHEKRFLYMVDTKHISLANLIIWIVIILGLLAVILCYQEIEMNHGYVDKTIFQSLMRPAWCVGLSWIVYSCYHGYGGVVNWILCRPIFQIWGRLTYCIYLLHGLVTAHYILTIRNRWYFSDYNAFYQFCGYYVVSSVLAVVWTLAFESPFITVEKFIFGGGGKRKHEHPADPRKNGNIEEGQSDIYKSREIQ
ncbi:hypothetical protein NQ318_013430 [Aromia moschata]|uniref:Acyltransferase 3 domain-containing protein n=1 Tax=Aromia moschata TaxID=1265417 RepID=A0AAV8YP49_9CUCU|nr:hypothetical protein NQ318_013430 [Aromia moschata]